MLQCSKNRLSSCQLVNSPVPQQRRNTTAWRCDTDVLVLRNEPGSAQSGACPGRSNPALLQEPDQSAVTYRIRKIGRRGRRSVRTLHTPLRATGMGHRIDTLVGGERVPVEIEPIWGSRFAICCTSSAAFTHPPGNTRSRNY